MGIIKSNNKIRFVYGREKNHKAVKSIKIIQMEKRERRQEHIYMETDDLRVKIVAHTWSHKFNT